MTKPRSTRLQVGKRLASPLQKLNRNKPSKSCKYNTFLIGQLNPAQTLFPKKKSNLTRYSCNLRGTNTSCHSAMTPYTLTDNRRRHDVIFLSEVHGFLGVTPTLASSLEYVQSIFRNTHRNPLPVMKIMTPCWKQKRHFYKPSDASKCMDTLH